MGILRSLFSRPRVERQARARSTSGRAANSRRRAGEAADCLGEVLRSRELREWRFRRRHPLGPFVVDFVCIEQALVIELGSARTGEPDSGRSVFLERLGFRVLRFAESEVLGDPKAVRRAIVERLRTSVPSYRRL